MTDPDLRLKAIFAADAPPARDPDFTLALIHRVGRGPPALEIVFHAAMASVAGGLLWAAWPSIGAWLTEIEPSAQLAAVPVGVASVVLVSLALFERAMQGASGRT